MRLTGATPSPNKTLVPAFDELAVVALRSLVSTEAADLRPGAVGTIVHRHTASEA